MLQQTLFSSSENSLLLPSPPLNSNPNPLPHLSSPLFLSPEKPPLFHHPHPQSLEPHSYFISPQMGCGISRMESGEEIPSGLLPLMRRIHDLKRTKTDLSLREWRERKDNIVSTTELLRPEEREIDYYDTTAMQASGEKDENNGKGNVKSDTSEIVKEKVEKAEEGRRIGFGRETTTEEEFPGSPSFRFYFTDVAQGLDNGGSVQAAKSDALKNIEEKELLDEKESLNESFVMAEGSAFKAIKKEKGRKFMALPKANFLNVRGCYNMNSRSLDAQEASRILTEKAT